MLPGVRTLTLNVLVLEGALFLSSKARAWAGLGVGPHGYIGNFAETAFGAVAATDRWSRYQPPLRVTGQVDAL